MIAKTLKKLRKSTGLSQPQLAKKIGVANSTISFWENGITKPKGSYIIILAKFFDVSTDYLLGLDDSSK